MARKLIIAFAAASASLTGCGPVNRGLESVNQPVVSRTDYVFDLAAPEYGGLSPAESARLDGWFQSLQLNYGDTIYVDDPQGYGDPSRRSAVAAVAQRYGLAVSTNAPVTQGRVPSGSMRVIVSRSGAFVPDCPNWDRPLLPEFEGSTTSNYGCATNTNLAAMIANPDDLVSGRAAGETTAIFTNKALQSIRDVKPTGLNGLKNESTGGK